MSTETESKQNQEKRIKEAEAMWEKYFTKNMMVTIIGKSCVVDCGWAIQSMKAMIAFTNLYELTPDIAPKVSEIFACKENIYAITLGVKRIDELGYEITEFGPIIDQPDIITNTIYAPIGNTSLVVPDCQKSNVHTFKARPSGFLCLVGKKTQ